MNQQYDPEQQLLTTQCSAQFVHIWETHAAPGSTTYKYGIQCLFPVGHDYSLINQGINDAIVKKWGNNPPPGLLMPLHDPMTKVKLADKPLYQGGKFYLSTSNLSPVPVFDQYNNELDPLNPHDRMKLFSGCLVEVRVKFKGYESGNNGISAYLHGVRIIDNVNVERTDYQESAEAMFGAPIAQAGQPLPGQQQAMGNAPMGQPQMGNAPIGQPMQQPMQNMQQPVQAMGQPQMQPQMGQPGAPMQQSPVGQPVQNAAAPLGQPADAPNAAGYPSNPQMQGQPMQQPMQPQNPVQGGPVINPLTGQPYPAQ